jgi:hypothetical protein
MGQSERCPVQRSPWLRCEKPAGHAGPHRIVPMSVRSALASTWRVASHASGSHSVGSASRPRPPRRTAP